MLARSIDTFLRQWTWLQKKSKVFSSSYGEEALILDGFLRDMDSRNHAINPVRLEKIRTTIKAAGNLHDASASVRNESWRSNKTQSKEFGSEAMLTWRVSTLYAHESNRAFIWQLGLKSQAGLNLNRGLEVPKSVACTARARDRKVVPKSASLVRSAAG